MASTYDDAGVRGQGDALDAVVQRLAPTFAYAAGADVMTRFGDYAAVLRVSPEIALAVSTDGVGSKTIVAALLDRYDTIGFDCVAMNVNDVICVGARPVAVVDYLGVNTLDRRRTDAILTGLAAAAAEAGVAIPGGEMAQLPEVIGSDGTGPGDDRAFDLVGTCVGVVHPERLVLGAAVRPGDAIVGISSSGIHSNGLTLARRVLLDRAGHDLSDTVAESVTVGDLLIEPTVIYVRAVGALAGAGIIPHGLAHITGDAFVNLLRLRAPAGYVLDDLPDPPLVFRLIQHAGDVSAEEMFRVFNMGVGFVAVVDAPAAEPAVAAIEGAGYRARVVGRVTDEAGVVRIEPHGLVGTLRDGDGVLERA